MMTQADLNIELPWTNRVLQHQNNFHQKILNKKIKYDHRDN